MNREQVFDIIEKYRDKPGGLIAILEEIQACCGYLPEETLRLTAERTGQSLADIYGVATFYRAFSLKPKGRHHISVCQGTACHIRGGVKVAEEFERQLGIRADETTADGEFSLETVNCLGACALGPITVIDGRYFPNMSPKKVSRLLKRAKEGIDSVDAEHGGPEFHISAACPHCGAGLMDKRRLLDGRASISLAAVCGGRRGTVRFSSLYGSFKSECEPDIPASAVVEFFCPRCSKPLSDGPPCVVCDAPMLNMSVTGGGTLHVCSRKGCTNHLLDIGGGETGVDSGTTAHKTERRTAAATKSARRPAAGKKAAPTRASKTGSR